MLQSLLNFVLLLNGHTMHALQINLYLLLLMAIIFCVVPFIGIPWKSLPVAIISKKTMFAIQFVILIIALLNLLPALGLGGSSQFSPYFGQLYGAVSGMIFLIYMRHRYRFIKEESVYALAMSNAQVIAEKISV